MMLLVFSSKLCVNKNVLSCCPFIMVSFCVGLILCIRLKIAEIKFLQIVLPV